MDTIQKLEQLAEFQAQADYLEIKKRELIDAVKVPDEVLAAQTESINRKRTIDSEYQKHEIELSWLERERLDAIVVPPEIWAAYQAIEKQRAEVIAEIRRQKAEAWNEACRKKEQVDHDLTDGVAAVYQQVEVRKSEINAEFSGKAEAVQDNIAKLTAEIKADVIREGKTVKATQYQAVYVKGRVTWNTDMLDGMIVAFPALAQARKEGQPSVTLRRIS